MNDEREIVAAALYAMRVGCLFPVPVPALRAPTEEWIRWGAMRNLHDAVAAFTRARDEAGKE